MRVLTSSESPAALDQAIRERLADSLRHVLERAGEPLGLDGKECAAALESIRRHRQMPKVFASYYQLVFAIRQNRLDEAAALAKELLAVARQEPGFRIEPFDRKTLGADFDRFPKLLFAEEGDNRRMSEIDPALFRETEQRLTSALRLLAVNDPETHGEILALWSRIYVARGSDRPGAKSFGGVTSFMVWGGGFMNAEAFRTEWGVAQFLVHEITHALLFALSASEALVRNPLDRSYKSPLRPDPRPMDGIFHATIVCARMAGFNRMCLDRDLVEGQDREDVARQLPALLRKFEDGVELIRREGMLSDRARLIVEHSCTAMSRAA